MTSLSQALEILEDIFVDDNRWQIVDKVEKAIDIIKKVNQEISSENFRDERGKSFSKAESYSGEITGHWSKAKLSPCGGGGFVHWVSDQQQTSTDEDAPTSE